MPPQDAIEDRLLPQIAGYKIGSYSLSCDLAHIRGVREVGAHEATTFYSARILEALAAAAVQSAGLAASPSAYCNLQTLMQFNLVAPTTLYWANGLRRLGNDVRHLLRPTDAQDADLAVLFAERWLTWFFCQFRFGPGLKSMTRNGEAALGDENPRLQSIMRAIDAQDFDPSAWLPPLWTGGEPPFMAASTLAAVTANLLLDRGDGERAIGVLGPARERFHGDLRLQQLWVLAWKRLGDLEKAVENTTPLISRSKDDDETAGIVAGVYKQVYLDRSRDPEMLLKSHRAYLAGWEGSRASNGYLGINASATALWLGRCADSRRLAGEVRQLLLNRGAALNRVGDAQMLAASYWDQVTLAEARLLLGELADARAGYQSAFAQAEKSRGNVKVARDQAALHLAPLGLTTSGDEFFSRPIIAPPAAQFILGVTGHRSLEDEEALTKVIIETIGHLIARASPRAQLIIISPLASGADCLVAQVVLDKFDGRLCAVLPLELAEYRRDFDEAQLARFGELLDRADNIVFPQPTPRQARGKTQSTATPLEDRQAAYERAGQFVANQCDALVAIWDGQPVRGRGGTADIVAHARQIAKPLAWINSQSPFEIRLEKIGG